MNEKIKELENIIEEHDMFMNNVLTCGQWKDSQMDYKVIKSRGKNIHNVFTQKLSELKAYRREFQTVKK